MRRRFALAALAAASAGTLLVGCGGSSSGSGGSTTNESTAAPETELADAFHSLTAGSALTTTLSLDTTAANLLKISRESGGAGLSPSQAALLASSRLVVESVAPDGETLREASAGGDSPPNISITGIAGGTTYFTLLVVNKAVYFQVDLEQLIGIAENHDGESTTYQRLVAQSSHLPPFAQAVVAGKFVSLPFSTISSLEALIKGFAQGSSAAQIPTGSQLTALRHQLLAAVTSDLTVARTSTGTTDQLVVTGNVRAIGRDVLTALRAGIPALASQINPDDANQAPNQDLKATASVTAGAVRKVEFDFGQFSPHQKDTLPVAATFAKSAAAISAPSGAVPISLADLVSFFTAVGSSSSSSGSGSAVIPVPSVQTSTGPAQ